MKASFFLLLGVLILLPSTALAFGPVAHVDMALEILSSAGLVGTAVASLISRYRRQFILGTLDPDRTLAKNLAPYEEHSHNWDLALSEYDAADNDEERARCLGRICHLAADTVAHNYYVPGKIVDSFSSRGAGHFFWEVRFDSRLRDLRGLPNLDDFAYEDLKFNNRHEIRYLKNIIRPTVGTRGINAMVTGLTMSIQKAGAYTVATRTIDRFSVSELSDQEVMEVRSMALQAQIAALRDISGRTAQVFQLDPRGISCLDGSIDARKVLRKNGGAGQGIMVGKRLRGHEFFRKLVVSRHPG